MNWLSVFLTGIGLSMDAFAVSVTIGMVCKHREKAANAIKAACYFGGFQGLMPLAGYFLSIRFIGMLGSWSNAIAFAILAFLGGKMIYETIKGDTEGSIKSYTHGAFLTLALATSIDALAVGVSLAMINVNIFFAAALIAATTAVIAFVAVFLGKAISGLLGGKAEFLGGIILIIIGLRLILM
ncbi:MAG: manganese efflux pump [Clostridia bacterium]|nr:manganese efflux pump [Clostridia bacterium]